jgi:amino-acid N-acetyltransferase
MFRKGLVLKTHTTLPTPLTPLQTLLEDSFGKALLPTYLPRLKTSLDTIATVKTSTGLGGAVIMTREKIPFKMAYLDKFAVSPRVQGIGMADFLWDWITDTYPVFVWRSRVDNPVNKW